MRTIKFISPLKIRLDDHEYEYFNEDEMPDVSPTEATYYAESITAAIDRGKRDYDDGPRGLMAYFDGNPAVSAKVYSAYPAVEERNGNGEWKVTQAVTIVNGVVINPTGGIRIDMSTGKTQSVGI